MTGRTCYVADAKSGALSARASGRAALPVLATSLDWAPDGSAVYAVLVPEQRMALPKEPAVADGPLVRMTTAGHEEQDADVATCSAPLREVAARVLRTGQLARIDAKGGAGAQRGGARSDYEVSISPDGQLLRVTLLQKPFSYWVPVVELGSEEQLWSATAASSRRSRGVRCVRTRRAGRAATMRAPVPIRDAAPSPGYPRAGSPSWLQALGLLAVVTMMTRVL